MGILLLRCVHAEHGHHGVADELLDDAAVRLDVLVPAQEVGVDDRADILGVELLGQHGEVDEVGEQDGDELALLGDGPVDQLGALGEQRPEGRVDDRVAEQAALRLERGDGNVDRRQVRHRTDRLTASGGRLLGGRGVRRERRAPAGRAARAEPSTVAPPSPAARPSASASSAVPSASDGAASPRSLAATSAPAAAVGQRRHRDPRRSTSASASASAHDGEDGELALVEVERAAASAAACSVRSPPTARAPAPNLVHADVTELGGVVRRPSTVGAVAGGRASTDADSSTPCGAGVERRSHGCRGSGPSTGRRLGTAADPRRTRTLDHAERRQRQHRRPRVVGEHAGVASRPPRRQLRPVEQDGQHERRADGAQQVGDGVEAGEVLAHHGDDRDPAAELEELDRPARHLHRLPPAQLRVQRGAEVVLQHLTLVEGPAMVLVLAVVPPPAAEARRRGAPSCRAAGRRGVDVSRTPGHEHADAVAGEHRLEVVDRVVGNGALGQHDDVDDVDLVEGRGQHAVDEIEVERSAGANSKKPNGSRSMRCTDGCCGRKSLARTRSGHGNSRRLGGCRRGSWPGALRRHLVPHGVDARTAHAGVAGERPQRDAAGGRAHLRQHPQPRECRRAPANRCGPAARGPAADGARRSRPEPSTATPMPAHASSATACSISSARAQRPVVAFGDCLERRVGAVADDRPRRRRRASAAGRRRRRPRPSTRRAAATAVAAQSPRCRAAATAAPAGGDTHEPVGLGLLEDDLGEGEHVGRPFEQVVDDRQAGGGSPHRVERVSARAASVDPRRRLGPASWCSVLPTSSSTARASPAAAMRVGELGRLVEALGEADPRGSAVRQQEALLVEELEVGARGHARDARDRPAAWRAAGRAA